jgi:hypothetical protein
LNHFGCDYYKYFYRLVAIAGDTTVGSKADAVHKLAHERFTLAGWHVAPLKDSNKANICIVFVHGAGRDRRAFMRVRPCYPCYVAFIYCCCSVNSLCSI